ncbi:MAG: sodium:proton antiporter [Zetaproteobacteria bacterium]|nr:MAG: sodium:proton antiporter [Zetaproteobacteria bacterium]
MCLLEFMHTGSLPSMTGAIQPTEVFVLAVLIAVTTQIVSARIRLPAIVLWLIAGMLLGPFGLHLLHVESVKPAMHTLIELGLAVILFEGGLNLNLRALKQQGWIVGKLLIFGPLLTMLVGGGLLHTLGGMNWGMSLLFGALVAVGGPTVIIPIVRQTRMDRELRHILTGEAMLIDATGAMLAIVMLQVVLVTGFEFDVIAQNLITKFLIGASVGWAGGWLLSKTLYREWIKDTELRSTATLAAVWGIFLLADHLSSQAGLLAVLVAGALLQRQDLPDIQRLRHFKGSLSMLLVSVLFVLLAADLNLAVLADNLETGLLIFLALAFIARPLTTLFSTLGSKLTTSQRGYLACMAPRGVVAAAITALFSLVLKEQGVAGGEVLESLVYTIIILSVLIYGILATPLSHWLKVEGTGERSVLIIGGGQIGAELGRVLGEDREVRFLDMNAEVINTLQRSGYLAVRGNALDPLYMEIAHAEEVGAIAVMTGSSDHNLLIAQLARDEFHVQEIYVALQEEDETKHARMIHQLQAKRLFAKPYNFTYWNDQAYRKRLTYEVRRVEENSGLIGQRMADTRIPHGIQPMAIIREGESYLPHDDFRFQAGDEIKMLMRPERMQEGQPLILPPSADHNGSTVRQAA